MNGTAHAIPSRPFDDPRHMRELGVCSLAIAPELWRHGLRLGALLLQEGAEAARRAHDG
jgi:hypothetical protein